MARLTRRTPGAAAGEAAPALATAAPAAPRRCKRRTGAHATSHACTSTHSHIAPPTCRAGRRQVTLAKHVETGEFGGTGLVPKSPEVLVVHNSAQPPQAAAAGCCPRDPVRWHALVGHGRTTRTSGYFGTSRIMQQRANISTVVSELTHMSFNTQLSCKGSHWEATRAQLYGLTSPKNPHVITNTPVVTSSLRRANTPASLVLPPSVANVPLVASLPRRLVSH